jgi:hypothetical protein
MAAAARIERCGIPIDCDILSRARSGWSDVKSELIRRLDPNEEIFENGAFRQERFAKWLESHSLGWPRTATGALALDDDTFKRQANFYSEVAPIRELRVSLSQLRLENLAVGSDGRNRCLLSAYRARTGRNAPSNAKFIFGPARWLRGLIRPEPGHGIAYIDWSSQEFAIAAALSGDTAMMEAYRSGDPYLAFARQAGAVPDDATRSSHGQIRERFKQTALAVQYGMTEFGLSLQLAQPRAIARDLLEKHRAIYRRFWQWSDSVVDFAMLGGRLKTVFGWQIRSDSDSNGRSLRNFPMQGNGSEMLRLACIMATEAGIRVCAPIHDALLIEAPLDQLQHTVATTQDIMGEASEIVLDGFRLRSEARIVRHPDRYMDSRGRRMWDQVVSILDDLDGREVSHGDPPKVSHGDPPGPSYYL